MIAANVFRAVLSEVFGLPPDRSVRVLDIGCGKGELVHELRVQGYDAVGADLAATLGDDPSPHCVPIPVETTRNASTSYRVVGSYRLPFEDGSFAAVVSSSTLEHVQEKRAFFAEIHRVLRMGGPTVHSFPSRFYLPAEPHIHVPLVSTMWPDVPRWWLSLWAVLGVRNEFQRGMPWREVVRRNAEYCRDGISYWSLSRYERLLESVGFREVRTQFEVGVRHAPGGWAWLLRRPAIHAIARALPPVQQLREVVLTAVRSEAPVVALRTAEPAGPTTVARRA